MINGNIREMIKSKGHKMMLGLLAALLLAGLWWPASGARLRDIDRRAEKAKAAYIFMQSLDAFNGADNNLYSELLDAAYAADPSDNHLKWLKGELQVLLAVDSAKTADGFRMMMESFSQRPDDYFKGAELFSLTSRHYRFADNLRVAEMLKRGFPGRNEATHMLANAYLAAAMRGDTTYLGRAVALYDSLEMAYGPNIVLTNSRIRAHAVRKDTAAIVGELSHLYRESPGSSETSMQIGEIYRSLEMPDSALKYFDTACRLDSANGQAILMRANLYLERGDSATFDKEVYRAIKSQDLEVKTKLDLVHSYVIMQLKDSLNRSRADEIFDVILDVNPGEYDVHRLYADYLAATGERYRAGEQMLYAVGLDGSNREDWLGTAQLFASVDSLSRAASVLDEARHRFPDDLQMTTVEASIYYLDKQFDKAVDVICAFDTAAITDKEELSQYYSSKGDMLNAAGRRADGLRAYEQAISANPFNYMALNNVAYYYADTDTLLDVADRYIRTAIRHEPDNISFIDTYAWVAFKQGDLETARRYIDRAIDQADFDMVADSVDVTIDSVAEVVVPDTVIVEEVVEPVVAREASSEVYDHAGDIYDRIGDRDRALRFWQKALDLDPGNAVIKEKIAKIKKKK